MHLDLSVLQPKSTFATIRWLAVNTEGEALHLELAKLRVTHYLGVQLRDLRLLDPQLATSYPSAILARERAIVVNLEFIKCIIAMGGFWLPSTKRLPTTRQDPLLLHFGPDLSHSVLLGSYCC
jgi:magnesium transporter